MSGGIRPAFRGSHQLESVGKLVFVIPHTPTILQASLNRSDLFIGIAILMAI